MKQPGLAAAESSKPELQPPEKHDRRSLCGMSMEPAEKNTDKIKQKPTSKEIWHVSLQP